MSKEWLHVLGLDGTIKAEYAPLDYLATPHAVTWDGSAYLFLSTEDRAFLLTEQGTLAAPAEGIEIAQAHNGVLASSTPGRAAMLTTQLTPENGLRRIFAQSLNRSDAAICDP